MPNRNRLTKAQAQEIVTAYDTKQATAGEIGLMYNINPSTLYRTLHQAGIEPHSKRPKDTPVAEEVEVVNVERVHNNHQMVVTTDSQNIVQSAQTVRRANISTWEIKYTGTIFIDAADVDEAIMEARKMGVVKRIYSVRVRSS